MGGRTWEVAMTEPNRKGATTPAASEGGTGEPQFEDSPLEAALTYAREGWAVFPCHNIERGVCTCGKGKECGAPGKHPRTTHGHIDATTNENTIRSWWGRWPTANV